MVMVCLLSLDRHDHLSTTAAKLKMELQYNKKYLYSAF